jgi:DNA-directed RNA polymerase subunit K/omega
MISLPFYLSTIAWYYMASKGKKKNIRPDHTTTIVPQEDYVPQTATRKTTPYMSVYEYSALIMARVLQLGSPGAMPLIPLKTMDDYDPLIIATKEVNARLPPLVIRRKLADGSIEDWLLTDTKEPLIFPRI